MLTPDSVQILSRGRGTAFGIGSSSLSLVLGQRNLVSAPSYFQGSSGEPRLQMTYLDT